MNFLDHFDNLSALEIISIGTIAFAVKRLENRYFWKIANLEHFGYKITIFQK